MPDVTNEERAFIANAEARNKRELDELVISLAFAIDDPAGVDELRLARALIGLGRAIPLHYRMTIALEIEALMGTFKRLNVFLSKAVEHE